MNHPEWRIDYIAQYIHKALEIVEAEKYATKESRFIFGVSGATAEDIAEIRKHLTPFENSVVEIENKPNAPGVRTPEIPENPALYELAKEICHKHGLPWTDPRTGVTYPPDRQEN